MPPPRADDRDAESLRDHIAQYDGLGHLRVRRRGPLLVVESGPADEPHPHTRFRRDTVHLWRLEMPTHAGAWQPTPHRDQLLRLFDLVATSYGWMLAPLE